MTPQKIKIRTRIITKSKGRRGQIHMHTKQTHPKELKKIVTYVEKWVIKRKIVITKRSECSKQWFKPI